MDRDTASAAAKLSLYLWHRSLIDSHDVALRYAFYFAGMVLIIMVWLCALMYGVAKLKRAPADIGTQLHPSAPCPIPDPAISGRSDDQTEE